MPYNINKPTGEGVVVPDNIISDEFYNPNANGPGKGVGIRLLGRNVIDYGAAVAQNFVQLAANFANDVAPAAGTALPGQLWFNTTEKELYVNIGSVDSLPAAWDQVGGANKPAIGTPLHNTNGDVICYTAAFVPSKEYVSDYEPLNVNNNDGFLGWLRKTSGRGMTAEIRDAANTIIGYGFPA